MSLNFRHPDGTEIARLPRQDIKVKGNSEITLTNVSLLRTTENDYQILKAKMAGKDVIVKFTYDDEIAIPRLEKESRIYVDYLQSLWGIHVPIFYGYYMGYCQKSHPPSSVPCACIILSYCGEPPVSDLSQLKEYNGTFRDATMDIVFRLHSAEIGLVHDALVASHILNFKGKPFIIDFAGAESHQCPAGPDRMTREKLIAKEGEVLQQCGPNSVRCWEIWTFLESLNFCIPKSIDFHGVEIYCEDVTSAVYLYETTLIDGDPFISEEVLWNESVTEWKRIRSNWRKYHPGMSKPPLGLIDFQEYLAQD